MQSRRVVVTGCGIICPVGIGLQKAWDSAVAGVSGIGQITQIDASRFDATIAGEVKGFDPIAFLGVKEARRTARFVQFALAATEEAMRDSGLVTAKFDPERAGVIFGSGIGSLQTIEEQHKIYLEKGPSRLSPFLIPTLITNAAAGQIAIRFHLSGVNYCTVTACASGTHAIGEAFHSIKFGATDVVVTGGTEAAITALGLGGFCALKALSCRNHEPERASRPFDRERDGFVMAEGAGVLILEELEHARKRNARIYAEIVGYGATCDAYHITAPEPTGKSVSRAMELALQEAQVEPREVSYINAHGTSTELNDKTETQAIRTLFKDQAKKIPVSSTKSITGHLLGAAGAIESVFCCMAIREGVIPPTMNQEYPDPECDLDYVPNTARKKNLDVVLNNSLGFGGHNISLAFRKLR